MRHFVKDAVLGRPGCHPLCIVTTSWDDGDARDRRLADMLSAKGMKGTFYVPIQPHNSRPLLSTTDLRNLLGQGHEIGCHTVSHRLLTTVTSASELHHEVFDCKGMLQEKTGVDIRMFCYPGGRYNRTVMEHVKEAGYQGARTTRLLCPQVTFPSFEMPTSLQAFPHRRIRYLRNAARAAKVSGPIAIATNWRVLANWVELGKTLFDKVLQHGGVWHLFGHSWEIDEHYLWSDLEKLLGYVANREHIIYATNAETLQICKPVQAGAVR
jgi:hypothetical protein